MTKRPPIVLPIANASPFIEPTATLPSAPVLSSVTPGNEKNSLVWTSVAGATSYNIYWSVTSPVTKADSFIGTVSPYPHSNLVNGITYYYRVTAVGPGGESALSNELSGTPSASAAAAVTPLFRQFAGLTNPGSEKTLITITTTQATKFHKLIGSCRLKGIFRIYADSVLIGSARTGAGKPNVDFSSDPIREIASSVDIVVKYECGTGIPQTDVEAYFMGSVN